MRNETERGSTERRITGAGNATIEVRLGDPIGPPESGRAVSRFAHAHAGDTITVWVFDQDDALRLEIAATWLEREGFPPGDADEGRTR